MATRETLISDLPPPQSGGDDQNLVQNIIQEYENVSSQPINENKLMESIQNPISQTELVSNDQFMDMQRSSQHNFPPIGGKQQQMPPIRDNFQHYNTQNDQYDNGGEYYEEIMEESLPLTTSQYIYYHVRLPILVAILVYMSNMRLINLYMIKYIPKMANRLGGLSQLGMIVKSFIFAIIFYLITTFLLK